MCARVDVLVQEVDGGLQADLLHRIERQLVLSFAVGVCLLEDAVRCQDSLDHRHGKRCAGL